VRRREFQPRPSEGQGRGEPPQPFVQPHDRIVRRGSDVSVKRLTLRMCSLIRISPVLAAKLRPHPHSTTCRTRSTPSCRYPGTTSKATSSSDARPRGNRFPPAFTPGQWCLIHFPKSKCVCTALLVKKTIGGTAPWPGSLKAPDRIESGKLNCIHKTHSHSGSPQFSGRWLQSSQSISVPVS